MFAAGHHSGHHSLHCIAVGRNKSAPYPRAAGKPGLAREFFVRLKHYVVVCLIGLIVIPIYLLHALGTCRYDLVGDHRRITYVIAALSRKTEEHIRPHYGLKIIFLGNLDHAQKMLVDNVKAVFKSVLIQIFSKPQVMSLIHANMNIFARVAFAQTLEHIVNKPVGSFLAQQ